ncbi:MAG TPA: hypothetical protein VNM72_08485 [Blastocatellia bacterium]|nr:hypothetical protein [Blastocatellia bacterium]
MKIIFHRMKGSNGSTIRWYFLSVGEPIFTLRGVREHMSNFSEKYGLCGASFRACASVSGSKVFAAS